MPIIDNVPKAPGKSYMYVRKLFRTNAQPKKALESAIKCKKSINETDFKFILN